MADSLQLRSNLTEGCGLMDNRITKNNISLNSIRIFSLTDNFARAKNCIYGRYHIL
jgi:hypothetical protein